MKSGIYRIDCTANGKFYIGSTKDFKKRWLSHQRDLTKGIHGNIHLQRIYDKHGIGALVFSVLEYCEPVDLLRREQHYIDTLAPEINIAPTAGSSLGRLFSRETKLRMRDVQGGKAVLQISHDTGLVIAKFDSANAAHKLTGADSRRISACCRGKNNTANGFVWRYEGWDQKDYIHKEIGHRRSVIATDKQGQEFLFSSIAEAHQKLNLTTTIGNIALVCKGKQKSSGGYFWRYADGSSPTITWKKPSAGIKMSVICTDKEGNEVWFPSTLDAERALGIGHSSISKVCLGKARQAHGYKFRYAD